MDFSIYISVQSTSRQLWAVVNFFITVIGGFTFGYFAAHFAGFDVPVVCFCIMIYVYCIIMDFLLQAVFTGLGLAIIIFIADLYFLVKSPNIVSGSVSSKKSKKE